MIQFNIHRFGTLAKWTMAFDKGFYIKTFLQALTVATLLFVFFTTRFFTFKTYQLEDQFVPCVFVFVGMLLTHLMVAPSVMFHSFKNKHDDQTYMMLPASNLEKYMARYTSSLLLLFVFLAALLIADLVQFLVNVLLGAENHLFVLSFMIERLPHVNILEKLSVKHVATVIVAFLWVQSIYALGATFFRSHKYAWIFTTLVIIVGSICFSWGMLKFYPTDRIITADSSMTKVWIVNVVNLVWAIVNYWLSFKCFCRSQVIGKYINM